MKFDVTTLLSILGIIGLAGGAVGYFGKARGDSIIKYQANEISLRDGTITRQDRDNTALLSENKILKDQNTRLAELAQGSPQLTTLTTAIETLTTIINDKLKS